ncbi:hypothetical protein V2P69_00140 [Mycoplasma capricolum subsp. capricolum]
MSNKSDLAKYIITFKKLKDPYLNLLFPAILVYHRFFKYAI